MPESDDTAEDAHADGKAAAERSEPISNNPHASGTAAHRRWRAGHRSVTAPDEIADDVADFA